MAEGLAGYYRVMEHSVPANIMQTTVQSQMQQSMNTKLEEPLRRKAESVMLATERERHGVESTPSGTTPSGSELGEEPLAKEPSPPPETAVKEGSAQEEPNFIPNERLRKATDI